MPDRKMRQAAADDALEKARATAAKTVALTRVGILRPAAMAITLCAPSFSCAS
jgi:hypothetical protein